MSKLFTRLANMFRSRTFVGADKAGNKYFTKNERMDGFVKEKRLVIFKGEEDPTTVPVEWICWLNGQRKKAPTPEEMAELEAKRERIKFNVALLKKEDEERKAHEGNIKQKISTGKVGGPDMRSFIQQYPASSSEEGNKNKDGASSVENANHKYRTSKEEKQTSDKQQAESLEPTGSGQSFKPGTWQPPV